MHYVASGLLGFHVNKNAGQKVMHLCLIPMKKGFFLLGLQPLQATSQKEFKRPVPFPISC